MSFFAFFLKVKKGDSDEAIVYIMMKCEQNPPVD